MEKTNNASLYWYVFYNDQLLLQKKADGYVIPCTDEAPVTVARSLPVEMQDGTMAMAAFTDAPLEETDVFMPMGLRASYDHIDRYSYDQAGKAYEIVYWDQHSRFCPVCGTPTELKGPIMKKCPHCGNEMFPSVSPAVLVLIRKGEEILLVHARNFRGTFYGLVAGFLEALEDEYRHQMAEVQAVRRRVEAAIQGDRLLAQQLVERLGVGQLGDQATVVQVLKQGGLVHCDFSTGQGAGRFPHNRSRQCERNFSPG